MEKLEKCREGEHDPCARMTHRFMFHISGGGVRLRGFACRACDWKVGGLNPRVSGMDLPLVPLPPQLLQGLNDPVF